MAHAHVILIVAAQGWTRMMVAAAP